MSENKPTEGPWRADLGEAYKIRDPHGGAVALISFMGKGGKFGGRRSDEEVTANAELIAAAPETKAQRDELLEAAEELIEFTDDFPREAQRPDVWQLRLRRLRAAIRRAQGGGDE